MQLSQEVYEDSSSGRSVKAENISVIGTFKYKADGFFSWTCGKCNEDHSSRAYKINGVIFECKKCFAQCLLLRSDCEDVNKMGADAGAEIRKLVEEENTRFIKMWAQEFAKDVQTDKLVDLFDREKRYYHKLLYKTEINRRMMEQAILEKV